MPRKEEKTYSADIVRHHIDMCIEMVIVAKNWEIAAIPLNKREDVEKMVEMVQSQFLEEFKVGAFYYYLDRIKTALRR